MAEIDRVRNAGARFGGVLADVRYGLYWPGAIKADGVCEQAHQQHKEELGLDHLVGRSWQGLHRHALMTTIAFAFLQARRLQAAGRKKATLHRHNQAALFSGAEMAEARLRALRRRAAGQGSGHSA